jgi:hypothetical protein
MAIDKVDGSQEWGNGWKMDVTMDMAATSCTPAPSLELNGGADDWEDWEDEWESEWDDDEYYEFDAYDWWYDTLEEMNIIINEQAWLYLNNYLVDP